jgi:threonine dehydrogenase-like Zn-dependent dehydrogenase
MFAIRPTCRGLLNRPCVLPMNTRRLAFCKDEIGVDHAFEVSPDIDDRLRAATEGDFFDVVLDTMRSGRVPVAALASHRGSLDEAPDLVQAWAKPDAGVIKALVEL